MIPRRQGKIIHIGSINTGISLTQVSVYTSTKGAVGQMGKAHAVAMTAVGAVFGVSLP